MAPRHDLNFRHSHHENCHTIWQPGHISSLKPWADFSAEQKAASGLASNTGACDHPVIVLSRPTPHTAIVTTISCFGSDERWCSLPPWDNQPKRRRTLGYRHMLGSAPSPMAKSAPNKYKAIQLAGDAQMPLPKSSWIHVDQVYQVPTSVLKVWCRMPGIASITNGSLASLLSDIVLNSRASGVAATLRAATATTSANNAPRAATTGQPDTQWAKAPLKATKNYLPTPPPSPPPVPAALPAMPASSWAQIAQRC